MSGINLSLRTIERNVSGSYNVGSLRLNADNKLEHVNSHVFKANNDYITKEENKAVRQAINSSFRNAYARNSATNVDLDTALNDVQKFLLGDANAPDDDTLHTELSRDEVRALLKGLYRINKGGAKNIAEGQRWIENAKVIRELKAGRIDVGTNYNLIAKDDRGSSVLNSYKEFRGIQPQGDVKLSKDFLRGCWKTGTAERWARVLKSGTGARKSVEIIATDTPRKIGLWLKDRLVLDGKNVSFDTTGWGPRSCQMAKAMEGLVRQNFDSWCNWYEQQNNNIPSNEEKSDKLRSILNQCYKSTFVDSTVLYDFFRTEHSLSPFPESQHKRHLKEVLLNNYNRDPSSGDFPGLYKDFIRVCATPLKGWLNVNAQVPKGEKCPYEFPATSAQNRLKIKAGEKVDDNEISTGNEDLIRKLCQIKNEKVRKMVTYTVSHDFPSDLFGQNASTKEHKGVIVGGEPFAAYQSADEKAMILPTLENGRADMFGKVDITVNKKENKVEMTIWRSVAPIYSNGNAKLKLKDSVCVEYKVTISPANGPGEPNVTVTSAKLLPNVKEIKPDV